MAEGKQLVCDWLIQQHDGQVGSVGVVTFDERFHPPISPSAHAANDDREVGLTSLPAAMHIPLRVARGIAKTEMDASIIVFETLKERGHPTRPPAIISDGWGGIREAMVEVYGTVPPYSGRGRPPTRKQPGIDWQYLQMVKIRNEQGRLLGVKLRAIFGDKKAVINLLGGSTAYIERTHFLKSGKQIARASK